MAILYQTLKKLREECGYTQQQIADVLQLERSTYAYYETGRTTPDVRTICTLAKIYHVPVGHLLNEEEEPKVSDTAQKRMADDSLLEDERVNTLTREEKQLLIYYRLMPRAQRVELLESLGNRVINGILPPAQKRRGRRKSKKTQEEE